MKQGNPQHRNEHAPQSTPETTLVGRSIHPSELSSLLPPPDDSAQVLQENQTCGRTSPHLLDNASWLLRSQRRSP